MSRIFRRVLRRYFFNKTVGFGHIKLILKKSMRDLFLGILGSFSEMQKQLLAYLALLMGNI